MMTRFFPSVLIVFSTAMAFAPMPKSRRSSRLVLQTGISFNPLEGYKSVNEDRARECAEHFGECPVEEMQVLRDNLHKERLQNFMFQGESKTPNPKALEHRMLEEDLDLQLHLLKEQDQTLRNPKLFPELEPDMKELPHLKDNTLKKDTEMMVHKAEHELAMAETILEESVLEGVAVCMVLAALWFTPALANF